MPHPLVLPVALAAGTFGLIALVKPKGKQSKGAPKPPDAEELKEEEKDELKELQNLIKEIKEKFQDWQSIEFDLDKFPYYLSERTKELLKNTVWVHLKRPDYAKFTRDFPCQSNTVLLTGPHGSELYQEALGKALAKSLQARILVLDSEQLLREEEVDTVTRRRILDVLEEPMGKSSSDHIEGNQYNKLATNVITLATLVAAAVTAAALSPSDSTAGAAHSAMSSRTGNNNNNNNNSSSSTSHAPSTSGTEVLASRHDSSQQLLDNIGSSDALGTDAAGQQLRVGDRVTYLSTDGLRESRPPRGATGHVICKYETVGVRFDHPVPGGNSLEGRCDRGYGHLCFAHDLQVARGREDNKNVAALFDTLRSEKENGPLIVFLRRAQQLEGCSSSGAIFAEIEKMEGPVVVIGSHTQPPEQKGKDSPLALDPVYASAGEYSSSSLEEFFSQTIKLQAPSDPALLEVWERQMDADAELVREQDNRRLLEGVLQQTRVRCPDLASVRVPGPPLKEMDAEDVIGWATSRYLMDAEEPAKDGDNLLLSADSLRYGLRMLRALEDGSTSLPPPPSPTSLQAEKKSANVTARQDVAAKKLKKVTHANKYEERILDVVVPADEVRVSFAEIGALEAVKEALVESVMLPLRRPELFAQGQLTQPCRGILLFGPPGTGKTMLAKAVATEAGANFMNITMSDILSKWLGHAEKSVRAIFSIASKIAPTVIFIDEVDSLLGKRGSWGEHETMRKVKNEFMANWDGLRTKSQERVLVLAATNRPFDLDEAIIRRFPRRLMVDLPNAENRAKILKVILAKEELAPDFDFKELAAVTDGYSGSDLKNLCVAAAHIPIREALEKEKEEEKEREREKQRKEEEEEAKKMAAEEDKGESGKLTPSAPANDSSATSDDGPEQGKGDESSQSKATVPQLGQQTSGLGRTAELEVVREVGEVQEPAPVAVDEPAVAVQHQGDDSSAVAGEESGEGRDGEGEGEVVRREGEGEVVGGGEGKGEMGGRESESGGISRASELGGQEGDGEGRSGLANGELGSGGEGTKGELRDASGCGNDPGDAGVEGVRGEVDVHEREEDGCVESGVRAEGECGEGLAVAQEGEGAEGERSGEEESGAAVHAEEAEVEAAPPVVKLRPLTMEDMRKAREQVSASTSSSAKSMAELREWNAMYGEGGSRKQEVLSYFM